jgi:hypothetical protein
MYEYGRNRSWPHLRYYPRGTEKNHENISINIVGNQAESWIWELPNMKKFYGPNGLLSAAGGQIWIRAQEI